MSRAIGGVACAGVILWLIAMAGVDVSAQCAMCRTVLASPEGQKMVAALRSGVLLLLAAPFVVFGTVATLAVRARRRRLAPADPCAEEVPHE